MKRGTTLSIALTLSIVLVGLTTSDSYVEAQQNQIRGVADTGVALLGPNQELILTVSGNTAANGPFNFRIRRMSYMQESCTDGVCKQTIETQTTSDVITVMPGEAVSIDVHRCISPICGGVFVRGVVLSDRQDVKVNALVRDIATGEATGWVEVIAIGH